MWELREKNPGQQVKQNDIIIDVLEGTCWREQCHHLTKNAEISHIEYIKHCAQFQILAQEDSC